MLTLLDIVQKSTQYLEQKGVENARRQAEEVISDAFNFKRLDIYLNFERPLTEAGNYEMPFCYRKTWKTRTHSIHFRRRRLS